MDRRSFVSSVSALGATAAFTGTDRSAAEKIVPSAPRVPTLPATNITVKSRYTPIPPLDNDVFDDIDLMILS